MNKYTPISFSRISTYNTCAKKFYHSYVLKDVIEEKSQAADTGVRAHEAIEHYLKDGVPIPAEFEKFKVMVDHTVKRLKGEFLYEHQMALKLDKTPTTWEDEDCWYRGILDMVCIHPNNTATVVDWKTGKPSTNDNQLKLFSGLIFAHYPNIQEVTTQYVWLAYNSVTGKKYSRESNVWDWLEKSINELYQETQWGTTPSGLCKNYCSVMGCEHNGKNKSERFGTTE